MVAAPAEPRTRPDHGGGAGGAALDNWLAPYREAWESSLDRLEAHLDRMDTGSTEEER